MKGLELARKYYESFGKELLEESFSDVKKYVCVGLFGEGSECYGFDDEVSCDHDFEPAFCVFIPDDVNLVSEKRAFELERAYSKLPKEFLGYKRQNVAPVGGQRHGVIRTGEFFEKKIGKKSRPLSLNEWVTIPSFYLSECTNGEIFDDYYGEVSNIRRYLSNMPKDATLKKLAGHLLLAAQSGQYNYPRCIEHKETGSAQMAAFEFVKNVLASIFLLNDKHMPYYKWQFRTLTDLPKLSELKEPLEFLISTDNSPKTANGKNEIIEDISSILIDEIKRQNLSDAICGDLEKHAYSVNDKIKDFDLKSKNILCGV